MSLIMLAVSADPVFAETKSTYYIEGTIKNGYQQKVIKLTNEKRKSAGRTKLKTDLNLQRVAEQRAAEIAIYYSHTRPNDKTRGDLHYKLKYGSSENISIGYYKKTTPKRVMAAWYKSKGHKKNILYKKFKAIGVGCFATKNADGKPIYFWVQVFSSKTGNNKYRKTKNVKTTKKVVSLKNIHIYPVPATVTLTKGKTKELIVRNVNPGWRYSKIKIEPESFEWSSSNPDIATVDNGIVTAEAPGEATIKAYLPGHKIVTYEVTIYEKESDIE